MLSYAYYPGCALEGTSVEYNLSAKALCQELGIELKELDGWNCCGASPAHMVDPSLALALPARNLLLAEKLRSTVVAPCPACFLHLKEASLKIDQDEAARTNLGQILGEPPSGGTSVKSLLQAFYEDGVRELLPRMVKRPLKGLKIAPYYGCLLVRPREIGQFDNDENPVSMDELLSACGAEIVGFSFKTECCGASLALPKKEVVLKRSGQILSMAIASGANAIAVACPLCHQNLDLRQGQISAEWGRRFNIPIYYFTQLIGIALGLGVRELGIDRHATEATGLKILNPNVQNLVGTDL